MHFGGVGVVHLGDGGVVVYLGDGGVGVCILVMVGWWCILVCMEGVHQLDRVVSPGGNASSKV